MADSSQIRSGITSFLQEKSATRVVDILTEKMPFFDMALAMKGGNKKNPWGVGRPSGGDLFLGAEKGISGARREKVMAERTLFFNLKTTKRSTTDVKMMQDYDSAPTVPNASTTNATLGRYKQARFRFTRYSMPFKIWHSEVRTAKPGNGSNQEQIATAIKSVYDAEVKDATGVLCEKINNQLFGVNSENGYPSNEDATDQWDSIYSLKKAIDSTNTYAGLDRSQLANATWRGNHVTTTVTYSFEDAINYFNYGAPRMSALGLGVNLVLVGGALMIKFKEEARAKGYDLFSNGVPDFPEFGFKREVGRLFSGGRTVYVVYDPSIPDTQRGDAHNEAAFLDMTTWTIAIPPGGDFKIDGPHNQKVNEGGDEADTGTIDTELLVACEVPKGNGYFDDWTA